MATPERYFPDSEAEKQEPAEFQFHQDRFSKAAESRWRKVKRLLTLNFSEPNPVDIAHEEALRDNAEFERRQTAEFQEWQKKLRVVAEHLFAKRDQTKKEGHGYKPLLVVMGGGMQDSYAAGQLLGMYEMGLGKVFDTAVGISGGSATAGMFVASHEQSQNAASIFMEECTTKEFIDLMRIHQVLDIRVLERTLRNGPKKLDEETIRKSPTNFYVGVTNKETGESELLDAKTAKPDMVAACAASAAAPIVFREAVEVNGTKYIDGGFDPLPLEKIIDRFAPTDVLLLPNTPFRKTNTFKYGPGGYLIMSLSKKMGSFGSLGTMEKFMRNLERFRHDLEYIEKEHNLNIAILWPPDSDIYQLSNDPDQIKTTVLQSARDAINQFGEPQPQKIRLYNKSDRGHE